MPNSMKKAKMTYQKGGSITKPRRTVSVTTKSPSPGTYGGTPKTTKTVTKNKRNGKTVTKTKSVSNPMNPFAKGTVSRSKTVTKGSGPSSSVTKRKSSTKKVSQKRVKKMTSKMKK